MFYCIRLDLLALALAQALAQGRGLVWGLVLWLVSLVLAVACYYLRFLVNHLDR